jgi:hypothetical protein
VFSAGVSVAEIDALAAQYDAEAWEVLPSGALPTPLCSASGANGPSISTPASPTTLGPVALSAAATASGP